MDSLALRQYVAKAPKTPGVYTWRDNKGRPLYIGKATNLKNRLANYLKAADPRIKLMVESATSLIWQETNTDIEALIMESQAIKKHRPKFNITMRDDKQYFYVGFTKEDFPRIFLTHQPFVLSTNSSSLSFIGPFTEGAPIKSTLRTLRRWFPYCTCKNKHHLRCLNAHIGNCPGHCCLRQPATKEQKAGYRRNLNAIRDILTGKRPTLILKLEREMKNAGKKRELEKAIELQTQIERIKRVFENAQINYRDQRLAARHHGALDQMAAEFGLVRYPARIEGYDVANMQGKHANGAMVAFIDGRANNKEYRLFNIDNESGSDTAMLRETIERRLAHPEWQLPDLIVVDGGKGQLNAVTKSLTKAGLAIPVISLAKNDRHQGDHVFSSLDKRVRYLKDMPRQLSDLIVHVDAEAHRFAIKHYHRRHRRRVVSH